MAHLKPVLDVRSRTEMFEEGRLNDVEVRDEDCSGRDDGWLTTGEAVVPWPEEGIAGVAMNRRWRRRIEEANGWRPETGAAAVCGRDGARLLLLSG